MQWEDLAGGRWYLVRWRTPGTGRQTLVSTGTNVTACATNRGTAGTTHYYEVSTLLSVDRLAGSSQISISLP